MKVLVACEESQAVCIAFRERGHEAFSCDIQACSGKHPEWHIQDDALELAYNNHWDLMIGHPPCTFISRAGARWLYQNNKINIARYKNGLYGKAFFEGLLNAPIKRIAIENPLPLKIYQLPKETQTIQPFQYGHPYSKRTLLWLKGLPHLKPTEILQEYVPYLPSNTGGGKRGQKATFRNISQKESSKTFPGIARAMAEQWG